MDQKFILHTRKIFFFYLLQTALSYLGSMFTIEKELPLLTNQKLVLSKLKSFYLFYVQIRASVKPSAMVHLICGNIKISGLILKYSA